MRKYLNKAKFNNIHPIVSGAMIVLLLLVALHYRTHYFDWGGDFAMYLQQAENIISGKPWYESTYIVNPDYVMLSPQYYPPFYSLLLVPNIYFFGNDPNTLIAFMAILYVGSTLLVFQVFLKSLKLDRFSALILSIFYFCSPVLFSMKNEVMADLPFTIFFLIFLLFWRNRNPFYLGIITSLAILTKSMGYALMVFYVFYLLLEVLSKKETFRDNIARLFGYSVPLILFLGLYYSTAPTNQVYTNHFAQESFLETVWSNLFYYKDIILSFFRFYNSNGLLDILSRIIEFLVLPIIALGVFKSRKNVLNLLPIIYISVLLIYPYQGGGQRFLWPVFIFLIYWVFEGFQLLSFHRNTVGKIVCYSFMGLSVLTALPRHKQQYTERWSVPNGPSQPDIKETLNFIKDHTNKDAIFLFRKPRVLGYFAERKSVSTIPFPDVSTVESTIAQFKVNYIWTVSDFSFPETLGTCSNLSDNWVLVFDNGRNKVFQRNP